MANFVGAAWMTAAMFFFALLDASIKLASPALPIHQILILVGVAGTTVFALTCRAQGLAAAPPALFRGPALFRSLTEACAWVTLAIGVTLIPLGLFTTIIQAAPILVALGASVFLNERIGWRRWLAIGLGLTGVLIVLRPGSDGFDLLVLVTVAGVFFQSARDLFTRRIATTLRSQQLCVGSFSALFLAGLILWAIDQRPIVWPDVRLGLLMLAIVGTGIPAVFATITAMRTGDVGAVVPFRYTRIVFGITIGMIVFAETLDPYTILGAAIIVSAGFYTLWREMLHRRTSNGGQSTL